MTGPIARRSFCWRPWDTSAPAPSDAAVEGYRKAIEVAEADGDERAQAEALRRLGVQHHHAWRA